MTIKISLDQEDFNCLVCGGVLSINVLAKERIDICLQDIGFDNMHDALDDVEAGKIKTYTNRTR